VYQDLCVELELEDWVKQERKQHGLTESTMTLTPPEIVAALVADVKKRAEAQLGMVSTAHHRTQPSTLGLGSPWDAVQGITRAVITVPPVFQDTQRQQTKGNNAGPETRAGSPAHGSD
jgi:molecular chaperone DnaK (HSP70)